MNPYELKVGSKVYLRGQDPGRFWEHTVTQVLPSEDDPQLFKLEREPGHVHNWLGINRIEELIRQDRLRIGSLVK